MTRFPDLWQREQPLGRPFVLGHRGASRAAPQNTLAAFRKAADVGADILATCCPYCILMLDDSLLTKNKDEVMQVMDISELVHEAMG